MWKEAVAETGIIFYLMLGVGIVGILAKVMNYVTLRKLVNAAGSMSKSTHKLMKLVRAKYEHACMVHDRVENVNAFVEKYIYEYRGFFLKIHTWRQIQIQSIWFAGILAAIGAVGLAVNDSSTGASIVVFCTPYVVDDSYDNAVSGNNADMFKDVITSMTGNVELASSVIPVKDYTLSNITINTLQAVITGLIIMIAVPILLIIIGIVVWAMRRKK